MYPSELKGMPGKQIFLVKLVTRDGVALFTEDMEIEGLLWVIWALLARLGPKGNVVLTVISLLRSCTDSSKGHLTGKAVNLSVTQQQGSFCLQAGIKTRYKPRGLPSMAHGVVNSIHKPT